MTGEDKAKISCFQEDLDIAAAAVKNGASAAAAKAGRLLAAQNGGGIVPLLKILREIGDQAEGAAFADRVIGKAAAMILVDARAGSAYGMVMSKHAADFLERHGVPHTALRTVEFIADKTGTGVCPIEKMSLTREDYHNLRLELEQRFFK